MGWSCPVCGQPLTLLEKQYRCDNRHCFDVARKGYVNLLLSQKSGSQGHGDNREMVAARRRFLDAGYYAPLCRELTETAARYAGEQTALLDAGCGECYYTAAVCERLRREGRLADALGVDISKEALAAGAARDRTIRLAVASVFHLPVADESVDLLTTVFAPWCGEEFRRVLRPSGILLMAIPDERHLWELKCAVYDRPYPNTVRDYALEGFDFLEKREVRDRIHLPSQEDIHALFTMTPYYYKTGRAEQARLAALPELETEIAFQLLVYRRQS